MNDKDIKDRFDELRKKLKESTRRKQELLSKQVCPRYDEIYYNGLEWMNTL